MLPIGRQVVGDIRQPQKDGVGDHVQQHGGVDAGALDMLHLPPFAPVTHRPVCDNRFPLIFLDVRDALDDAILCAPSCRLSPMS